MFNVQVTNIFFIELFSYRISILLWILESSGLSSRTSSIASISSGTSSAMGTSLTSDISRSPSSQFPHSPVDIPPIDPMAVEELEMAAKRVADNVDLLMGNLKSNLHKVRKTIHSVLCNCMHTSFTCISIYRQICVHDL